LLTRIAADNFVKKIQSEAQELGFNTSDWIIDHICYRTSTFEEYQRLCHQLVFDQNSDLNGRLLSEAPVNGRPISTIRLNKPLSSTENLIEAIELPAPKPGKPYLSGFEHIEVVIIETFNQLETRHPSLEFEKSDGPSINPEVTLSLRSGRIKFHHLPLSSIIAIENHHDLHQWLESTNLMAKMAAWRPLFSGSIPLEIDLPGSDLDILLEATDLERDSVAIKKALGRSIDLTWKPAVSSHGGRALIARIKNAPRTIELFLSETPVLRQNSHRHLLSEYLYLLAKGESLRTEVRKLKQSGLRTEPAFAAALDITGDPYQELLKWPSAAHQTR
jgi:predicted metalloenzyme YecM